MIKYTTGNLFESNAEAFVNTVNCEGYMGKGIAYQFKLKYPENNKSYISACKTGALRIGTLHSFKEKDTTIINFPTKNKWRAKSKMSYIEVGLDELIKLINTQNIKSIALPPLGSGNGGLIWADVKNLISKKLSPLSNTVDIIVYEPSRNYSVNAAVEPKLHTSALVLMDLKAHLNKFGALRLQKAAYFTNLFLEEEYFKFDKYKFGPYANSIAIISKDIKEYQKYHNVHTNEAYEILLKKLVSKKINDTLNRIEPALIKATEFVNNLPDDHQLECVSTIAFIVDKNPMITSEEIILRFNKWSKAKSERFSDDEIRKSIDYLISVGILESTLAGIVLSAA